LIPSAADGIIIYEFNKEKSITTKEVGGITLGRNAVERKY